MKKLALSVIFCTFGTLFIYSQEIFVKNGFTLSRMYAKIPILDKNITNYTIFVGGEYFVHKHYEISSEIGYLVKGGQDEISTVSGYENISKTIPFVQLGTTFRAKLSNQNNALRRSRPEGRYFSKWRQFDRLLYGTIQYESLCSRSEGRSRG